MRYLCRIVSVWPIQEAPGRLMFFHNDIGTIKFISQCIISMVRINTELKINIEQEQLITENRVVLFIKFSRILLKKFKEKGQESVCCIKKVEKEVCFHHLGHPNIYAANSKAENNEFKLR